MISILKTSIIILLLIQIKSRSQNLKQQTELENLNNTTNINNPNIIDNSNNTININVDPWVNITSTIQAKRYRIDIDQPIEPQIANVYTDFKTALDNYATFIKLIPNVNYLFFLANIMSYWQPKEWHDEIEMLARITNYPKELIIVGNVAYEIQCTSLIVRNSENKIFMGRNLDYPGTNLMAHLSLEYAYYKNNTLLYISATQFGNVGINNAIVPGKFTVSINKRKRNANKLFDLIRIAFGYHDPGRYLRLVMEQANSYNEALNMLQSGSIASSVYYIISGVKDFEGAIIARDYNKPVLVDHISEKDWFIVQTNYDRNLPDPENDYRRVPVEERLKALGNNITYQDLYDLVNSKIPSFRAGTIFTTIQSAEDNYFNTTIYFRDNQL